MPEFPMPSFSYHVDLAREVAALRLHKRIRQIPRKAAGKLLLATWNIANLGAQKRDSAHRALIAEILSWFDIVAVQEVRDNWADLEDIVHTAGSPFRILMSDVAGNNERMAYMYNGRKLRLLDKVGEIAVPPSDHRHIRLPGIGATFTGFDRNPYIAAFEIGRTSFLLVNVHLYFGSTSKAHMERRTLETFAVARWADMRRKSTYAYTREIIALGDFNMPKAAPGDPIYDALTRRGLELPRHSTEMGSTIASDKHYDQIAFLPGRTKDCFTGRKGVFDFDTVMFADLWDGRGRSDFNAYMRYYISDHRPMWIEVDYTR